MIRSEFPDCNVIRATSPIDGESLWVEIFPKGVNKGEASDWLSRKAMVSRDDCLVLGNDYNDIDMLSWARAARVVGNAPEDIKRMFPSVAPQAESGFSDAVESWLASRDIR
jgi:hydroxymethylpyrimidine pyrophosphatase-like HAD family hydrolase